MYTKYRGFYKLNSHEPTHDGDMVLDERINNYPSEKNKAIHQLIFFSSGY